ncbi:hypothetical protein COV24_03550 [candidate division WWE3 bacterium CG10_big_fil_rev_8_21_14_0_10_32_10]|uniref:Uncharacterized protein n=1 Tax=candidate division WWE3 bacterium CG10_big_fil_rev_8_21_14_0_10_32_10 TaxID=1975090 RepID=A0A2H0RA06_UNCKA|nr:MAG: hypothetical protein COV24_03550 [candidate division WWE3 bacterium CG10_big_fil_rev_8_21_14_0_10_32_10]
MEFHSLENNGDYSPKLTEDYANNLTTSEFRMIANDLCQNLTTIHNAKIVIHTLCDMVEDLYDLVASAIDEESYNIEEDEEYSDFEEE